MTSDLDLESHSSQTHVRRTMNQQLSFFTRNLQHFQLYFQHFQLDNIQSHCTAASRDTPPYITHCFKQVKPFELVWSA